MAKSKSAAGKPAKKIAVKKPGSSKTSVKKIVKKRRAKTTATKAKIRPRKKTSSLNKPQDAQIIHLPDTLPPEESIEIRRDRGVTRGMPEAELLRDCKCLKRKTKFYCYRLVQGAWQQVSPIGYPTKQSCEEDNCFA